MIETKKRRLAEIVEVQYQLSLQNNLADIGKTFEVLVEKIRLMAYKIWLRQHESIYISQINTNPGYV